MIPKARAFGVVYHMMGAAVPADCNPFSGFVFVFSPYTQTGRRIIHLLFWIFERMQITKKKVAVSFLFPCVSICCFKLVLWTWLLSKILAPHIKLDDYNMTSSLLFSISYRYRIWIATYIDRNIVTYACSFALFKVLTFNISALLCKTVTDLIASLK